ncbi:S9 family peptidase [Microtetraspora sp. AC03309]|uniref:prolyl oligopeptidase family serine peptidase n=1 Tax=Microtetraspora sp. AC03309 TaxID=2779376 RepID=UPI001E63E6FD|nr:prolyl oligopeptidase family serine peptidase [Microtetraspora sp. AC03309]MCC5581936.1 S9 family peptidase [Microtetraspora sp. AC03309]
MRYPYVERQPIVDRLHGVAVPDPYRRLEDAADPETIRWLTAQDDLWRAHAATLAGRDHLRARLTELADAGLVTAPLWRGERAFFLRRTAGQEHAVLHVTTPGLADAPWRDEVLLDPWTIDPTGLTTLDAWQPDPDGRLVAYQISRRGDERAELYVMDVRTRRVVDGPIGRSRYSPVAWLPGGTGFFYVRNEPRGVFLHRVGVPDDVLVFGREGVTSYGLEISHDGRWLVVSASRGSSSRNDLWLADLSTGRPERPDLRVVQENADARTAVTVGGDGRLYVVTDRDAPRIRLCVGDPATPDVWKDLVPADPEAVLADFAVLDGTAPGRPLLLVTRIRHAISEIDVLDLVTGERLGSVPLPGAGTVGPLSVRRGHEAWFTYTDHVTPPAVWRFDARTGETVPWSVPGPGPAAVPRRSARPGAGEAGVESHRLHCVSADGTRVRMVVIARAGLHGPRPAILYGYGGFGVSLTPAYAADTLAWAEAGGVVAVAMLRGGGEEGEEWHRAGMLERKQNVFDDFVAAAEKLIADGWTTPDRLGIWGESNGGLLVGAALTQRPELFAAAVCSAPLLDMVRYERSGLGPAWRGEYGSVEDPDQFRALLAYSPYHRVRKGANYPATLFTAFGGDTRVDPAHARKMCAALQWATGGDRPILLRHEGDVGHGSRAASRSTALAADMLAFLAAHTGLLHQGR